MTVQGFSTSRATVTILNDKTIPHWVTFLNELTGLEKSNHYAVPHDFCGK